MHSRNSCKTLKCPRCNWHYKYQETLEIHMKEKHPENELNCLYCLTNQSHPRLARGETYTCGYKPYRCEVCNYSTTTKGNLSIHMTSDKHMTNIQQFDSGSLAANQTLGQAAGPTQPANSNSSNSNTPTNATPPTLAQSSLSAINAAVASVMSAAGGHSSPSSSSSPRPPQVNGGHAPSSPPPPPPPEARGEQSAGLAGNLLGQLDAATLSQLSSSLAGASQESGAGGQQQQHEGGGSAAAAVAAAILLAQQNPNALEDYMNSQDIAKDAYEDPTRKFKCHRCKVAFTRQSYLTAHNKTLFHRKGEKLAYPMEKYLDPNRPFKCEICKESFTQKSILLVHNNSVSHLNKLRQTKKQAGGSQDSAAHQQQQPPQPSQLSPEPQHQHQLQQQQQQPLNLQAQLTSQLQQLTSQSMHLQQQHQQHPQQQQPQQLAAALAAATSASDPMTALMMGAGNPMAAALMAGQAAMGPHMMPFMMNPHLMAAAALAAAQTQRMLTGDTTTCQPGNPFAELQQQQQLMQQLAAATAAAAAAASSVSAPSSLPMTAPSRHAGAVNSLAGLNGPTSAVSDSHLVSSSLDSLHGRALPNGAKTEGLANGVDLSRASVPPGAANQHQQAAAAAAAAAAALSVQQQKRARTRISEEQLQILRQYFDINNSPTEEQLQEMSVKSELPLKVIKHWFRNTLFKERQKNKDSPYNFNNPPMLALNLEEYERTGEAKVTPISELVNGGQPAEPTPLAASPARATPLPELAPAKVEPEEAQEGAPERRLAAEEPGERGLKRKEMEEPENIEQSAEAVVDAVVAAVSIDESSAGIGPSSTWSPSQLQQQLFDQTWASVQNHLDQHGLSSKTSDSSSHSINSSTNSKSKRANRTRFSDQQVRVLQEFYQLNHYPKDDDLECLSKQLGLSPRVIVVWFQNARQKARKVFENRPTSASMSEGDDDMMILNHSSSTTTSHSTSATTNNSTSAGATASTLGHLNPQALSRLASQLSGQQQHQHSLDKLEEPADDDEEREASAMDELEHARDLALEQEEEDALNEELSAMNHEAHEDELMGDADDDDDEFLSGAQMLRQQHEQRQQLQQQQQLLAAATAAANLFGGDASNLLSFLAASANQQQQQPAPQHQSALTHHSHLPHHHHHLQQHQHQQVVGGATSDPLGVGQAAAAAANSTQDASKRDKRLRTQISPEQLDYLYQKYEVESNPSRKTLESIAQDVGLSKRVVQVWFQNTRARERRGQLRVSRLKP